MRSAIRPSVVTSILILAALALIVPTLIRFGDKEKQEEPQLRIDCSDGAFGDLPANTFFTMVASVGERGVRMIEFTLGERRVRLRIFASDNIGYVGYEPLIFQISPERLVAAGEEVTELEFGERLKLYSRLSQGVSGQLSHIHFKFSEDTTLASCFRFLEFAAESGLPHLNYSPPKPPPPPPPPDPTKTFFFRQQMERIRNQQAE